MENHFSQNTAAANKSVQKDPRKEDCHNNYSHRGKGASKKMVKAEVVFYFSYLKKLMKLFFSTSNCKARLQQNC